MVKFEVRTYYSRGFGYSSILDKECSVPVREITEEQEAAFKKFLEAMGCRRHETETQVFFEMVEDSNRSTEYIFYKEA